MTPSRPAITDTQDAAYAERLLRLQTKWWKKLLPVQAPYRWNMLRLKPGFTLDIGCGIGRSLRAIDGNGVGVDHNADAIRICRGRGLHAFTVEDFAASAFSTPDRFDTLMLAHTVEHMTPDEAIGLIRAYLPVLKTEGRLLLLTPQERGYASDASHVTFVDYAVADRIARGSGFEVIRQYSFPFPRTPGRHFIYNEFVTLARRRGIA